MRGTSNQCLQTLGIAAVGAVWVLFSEPFQCFLTPTNPENLTGTSSTPPNTLVTQIF
jgi:hypothetical protein